MTRLIDADALWERHCEGCSTEVRESCKTDPVCATLAWVDEAPTIEAKPIVRCSDCAVPHNKWTGCPKLNGLVPPDDFYCAFGVMGDKDGKSD